MSWQVSGRLGSLGCEGGFVLLKYLYIALGGAFGSLLRFWVGTAVTSRLGWRFPYGTFIINLTACVMIGFALTVLGRHTGLNPGWRFAIPIGFVGAYSTFSTYEWEIFVKLQSGSSAVAFSYMFLSLGLGLVCVAAGADGPSGPVNK